MTAVGSHDHNAASLEFDDICDSRKFVSQHVYPGTGPDRRCTR